MTSTTITEREGGNKTDTITTTGIGTIITMLKTTPTRITAMKKQ